MSLDELTLLAYVDGELPMQRRLEVEAALAANADLARTVRALHASRLPYQSAFDEETMPRVPDALKARIEELSAVSAASHSLALAGPGSATGSTQTPGWGADRWKLWALIALTVGALAGWLGGQRVRQPEADDWVRHVSSYHSMYVRETVLDGGVGTAQINALKARLGEQFGLQLKVPDLEAGGLRFVRAQQLQFDGKMVLQLVYLPQQGLPVALCLTPAASGKEGSTRIDGQQAVTWYDSGWAYVLIGQQPAAELERIRGLLRAPLV
jgi:anti-sigma factor RsiW